jgi:hypothetical protein
MGLVIKRVLLTSALALRHSLNIQFKEIIFSKNKTFQFPMQLLKIFPNYELPNKS